MSRIDPHERPRVGHEAPGAGIDPPASSGRWANRVRGLWRDLRGPRGDGIRERWSARIRERRSAQVRERWSPLLRERWNPLLRERWGALLHARWPILLFLGLVALQLRALQRVPLAAFGAAGAEYIPHLQRLYASQYLAQHGVSSLLHPWATLRALDGQYPALLHLVAAVWTRLAGIDAGQAFAWVADLNLIALAVLAWTVARLARPEGTSPARPAASPSSSPAGPSAADAAAFALLLPGLFAAARRYYYDLPMTAAIFLAAVCLLTGPGLGARRRALEAALATAAALLFKWAAGLYLAPLWLLGLARARGPNRARAWLHGLAALGLTAALCAPVALRPGGSFAFQWRLGAGSSAASITASPGLWAGLRFYAAALWSAGLGPGLTLALGVAILLALTARSSWRLLLCVLTAAGLPLLYLAARVPARDGRYLIPLLPWAAVVLATGGDALRHSGRAWIRWGGRAWIRWNGRAWRRSVRASRRWGGWTWIRWRDRAWRRSDRAWTALVLAIALAQLVRIELPADSPVWRGIPMLRGRLEPLWPDRPAPAGVAPREGWRAWWWTGAGRDVASPARAFGIFARSLLESAPGGRVLAAPTGKHPAWTHAWSYHITALSGGGAALVALPSATTALELVTAIDAQVDGVALMGPGGRPETLGEWLEASVCAGGRGDFTGRSGRTTMAAPMPVDGLPMAVERLRQRFPVHRALLEEGLEVHLYTRSPAEVR